MWKPVAVVKCSWQVLLKCSIIAENARCKRFSRISGVFTIFQFPTRICAVYLFSGHQSKEGFVFYWDNLRANWKKKKENSKTFLFSFSKSLLPHNAVFYVLNCSLMMSPLPDWFHQLHTRVLLNLDCTCLSASFEKFKNASAVSFIGFVVLYCCSGSPHPWLIGLQLWYICEDARRGGKVIWIEEAADISY